MKRDSALDLLSAKKDEIRSRFAVSRLALFGSVARDEAVESSDIDFIVTFDGPATFDRFMDLKFYLENLLSVRVDLVTQNALRTPLLKIVEEEAIHVA